MEKNVLLNERVIAGNKTYYIELKSTSNNKKYITINEKRTNKDGNTEYSRVLLFEESFESFLNSLTKVVNEARPLEKSSLEKLKEKYPNAYNPWTPEDDKKLEILFGKGKTTIQLTEVFQRQLGAIEARINKLQLQENTKV